LPEAVLVRLRPFLGEDAVHIPIKANKFSATVHPNSKTVDKLSGSFKGASLSGTLFSSTTTGGIHPTTCISGKVKFSASSDVTRRPSSEHQA
jgi:hypothetical protein